MLRKSKMHSNEVLHHRSQQLSTHHILPGGPGSPSGPGKPEDYNREIKWKSEMISGVITCLWIYKDALAKTKNTSIFSENNNISLPFSPNFPGRPGGPGGPGGPSAYSGEIKSDFHSFILNLYRSTDHSAAMSASAPVFIAVSDV